MRLTPPLPSLLAPSHHRGLLLNSILSSLERPSEPAARVVMSIEHALLGSQGWGGDAAVLSGRLGRFRREGRLGLGLEDAASAARCRDGAARVDGGLRAYRRGLPVCTA